MNKIKNFRSIIALLVIILATCYLLLVFLFRSKLFFQKDRVNIISQSDKPTFYSMGLEDGVNYFIPFFSDLQVTIPGGYGKYRLGALGKLSNLEKKTDLYQKTYSFMTSSFANYYLDQNEPLKKARIYFGKEKKDFSLPGVLEIFLSNSNANFLERIYIYFLFFGKTNSQFKEISLLPFESGEEGLVFSPKKFFDRYLGYFYNKVYRQEDRVIQILYEKSYTTASAISNILEGEGIRVADLSKADEDNNRCEVVEDRKNFSKTAKTVADFFNCKLTFNKTDAYDIIFKLGNLEKEWEVN